MTAIIVGSLAAVYCALWLISGLAGRPIPDNLLRMISRDDERFKVMLGAYTVGLVLSVVVIIAGLKP